ncbi:MAG TPA: hypothetical protein ENG63_03215 [Candidatus Desulfofervidus auxilii]|uniref:Uncharacterized protein n=1 Tax=Desulfofervidus auxilii TaxID=1621989 RepID=A0A7C0U2B5_DESA2|nr:hypothetical protein [Candidatus Desulfofervidus auxilii]
MEEKEFSLEKWEQEINKELSFLEEILDEKETSEKPSPTWQVLEKKLNNFLKVKDKSLGEEILSQCESLISKTDKSTQLYLRLIQNLVKGLLKFENISQLLNKMVANLPLIFSNANPTKKEDLVQSFYYQYQTLKGKPTSSLRETNLKKEEIENLLKQVIESVEAKLHEINIKVEENQRTLHRLLVGPSSEKIEQEKIEGIKETPENEAKFYILEIGEKKFALPAETVVNVYKISPKKAKKLTQKSLIKFGQLGSFFNPITKGLKGELKKVKKSQLKNMFLNVFQPAEGLQNNNYNGAVVVKVSDIDSYGVIFVDRIPSLDKPISGKLLEDKVETPEGTYPFLNLKALWTEKQIELGLT